MTNLSAPETVQVRVRISEAALQAVAIAAARETRGVVDIIPGVYGSLIGGAVGGAAGMVAGTPGIVVGAAVGAVVGGTVGHTLSRQQQREHFLEVTAELPQLTLALTAEYGYNLVALAQEVRLRVKEDLERLMGLRVERIEIVFQALQ